MHKPRHAVMPVVPVVQVKLYEMLLSCLAKGNL
jgi:hypothetical protein